MDVKVVHDENDLLCFRVHLIAEMLDLKRPVHSGAMFHGIAEMVSRKRLDEGEDAACAVPDILGVCFQIISRAHRQWIPGIPKQLVGLLVHADNGFPRIVWHLVYVKNIFHSGYEFGISLLRDAPVRVPVRSNPVFYLITVVKPKIELFPRFV